MMQESFLRRVQFIESQMLPFLNKVTEGLWLRNFRGMRPQLANLFFAEIKYTTSFVSNVRGLFADKILR